MPVSTYEGMFLLDSTKAATAWEDTVKHVHDILTKHHSEIVASRQWDERRLAYSVDGHKKGTYLLTYFKTDGTHLHDIVADCHLSEVILRELILKVSGFSEKAWGARGVFMGSDLPQADWAAAVNEAISGFAQSPFVLQRYEKPKLVESTWFDFDKSEAVPMKGRVRLCPYYFVGGEGDSARAQIGGILATVVPADKKIIHGMTDAILAPCMVGGA